MRYFEDLEIGDTFETDDYTIAKEEIIEFAEQFDPQPFHINEEAAKDSIFGELVASGNHTLCIAGKLFVEDFVHGTEGLANLGGGGIDELRIHEPVKPGDNLQLRIEVFEKTPSESRSDRGYVDLKKRLFNGDGEEVLSYIVHLIVKRRNSD